MNRNWHFSTKTVILLHILAWVLFFSLPLLLHSPFNNPRFEISLRSPRPFFDLYHTVSDLMLVGIFYLNVYWFLPRLIEKRKTGRFLGMQLLIFILYVLINALLFHKMLSSGSFSFQDVHPLTNGIPRNRPFFIRPPFFNPYTIAVRDIFPYILILACSVAYRMAIDRIRSERRTKERENENLKTELLLLRSQINPHFMFNVLNNMVSLARKGSDQLESSLIKLSSLMRYMYFDATDDKVLLSKEIDYIESYIDIQEQRFMGSVTVKTEFQHNRESYLIEPMLLIPFVENAFKHGTGLIDDAEIDIKLRVREGALYFFVGNKFSKDGKEEKDKTTGIGLVNVKRRLTLLYGDRYHLEIRVEHDWHFVTLDLNLN